VLYHVSDTIKKNVAKKALSSKVKYSIAK
jgi:hypothetical protein